MTGGESDRAIYERLHSPADLERWMDDAFGVGRLVVRPRQLGDAKRLREAIWQLADARVERRSLPADHVAEINRWAARPPLAPQIGPDGGRLIAAPAVNDVLATLARDAVELLTGPLGQRIRRCAGTNCTLVFADASRPGRRRWCSMERCGNRAKVGAFRHRHRKEEPA